MASRSRPPPLPYPDPLDDVSLSELPTCLATVLSIADRFLLATGAPSTEPPFPRFSETAPPLDPSLATAPSTSPVTAGVDGESGGVGVRPRLDVLRAVFGRFLPDPPFLPEASEPAAVPETVVPSERASSSEAESWNHLARHCCAVRPVSILLMLLHLGPRESWRDMSFLSSGSVHASFLTLGSRWRRQRPMHCWSVRPSRCLAISAHRWPCCS
mmetsp:Transcript_3800/g.15392  ORF Transcript_3800/g.15392 Transcript_3800/m.15392 type:complete len:214 (-) Transcript_3800:519-1160(-)